MQKYDLDEYGDQKSRAFKARNWIVQTASIALCRKGLMRHLGLSGTVPFVQLKGESS
jgi:hypothetical protein